MTDFREALNKLKSPFPAEKLSWRLGQTNKAKTKAMMLVYIDARDVMDRLDDIIGSENWQDEYREEKGRMICRISIWSGERWVHKEDGAGDTDFEGEKGGISDAFKRTAVKWGIGRYLYNARDFNTWIPYAEDKKYSLYKDNKSQLDEVARKLSLLIEPDESERVGASPHGEETNEQYVFNCKGMIDRASDVLSLKGIASGKEFQGAIEYLKKHNGQNLVEGITTYYQEKIKELAA